MDKNMTLEKRIDAELYSYQGRMSVFVDDLQGHTVERGADEEFETRLVETTDIAGTASRIADHHNASQFKKH